MALPEIPPDARVPASAAVPLGWGVKSSRPSSAPRRQRISAPKRDALRSAASGTASLLAALAVAYLIWDRLKGLLGDPLIALMLVLLLAVMVLPIIYDREV